MDVSALTTARLRAALGVLLSLSACRSEAPPEPSGYAPPSGPAATGSGEAQPPATARQEGSGRPAGSEGSEGSGGAAVPDARDQYAFLSDLQAARSAGTEQQEAAMAQVRQAWVDRRYHWQMLLVPELCRNASSCHVTPFDTARIEGPVMQGWLPGLSMDESEFARLQQLCQSIQGCVIEFEGTLSRLVLQSDQPTSLGFTDVHMVGARGIARGETWGLRWPTPRRP